MYYSIGKVGVGFSYYNTVYLVYRFYTNPKFCTQSNGKNSENIYNGKHIQQQTHRTISEILEQIYCLQREKKRKTNHFLENIYIHTARQQGKWHWNGFKVCIVKCAVIA